MDGLLFTPNSIGALANFMVSAIISIYFWRLDQKSIPTRLLAYHITANTIFVTAYFLTSSSNGPWRQFFVPVQFLATLISMAFQLQFACYFPLNSNPNRTRIATYFSIISVIIGSYFCGRYLISWSTIGARRYDLMQYVTLLTTLHLIITTVVFFRNGVDLTRLDQGLEIPWWQALFRPKGRFAKASALFGLFNLGTISLGVINILFLNDLIPGVLYYVVFNAGLMSLLTFFVLIYLNNTPDETYFMPKLLMSTILIIMAVLGVVGNQLANEASANFRDEQQLVVTLMQRQFDLIGVNPDEIDFPTVSYVGRFPVDTANSGSRTEQFELLFNQTGMPDRELFPANLPFPENDIITPRALNSFEPNQVYYRENTSRIYQSSPDPYITHLVYFFEQEGFQYEIGFSYDAYRVGQHAAIRWLIAAIFVSAIFVLVVFPRFFNAILLRPLQELLDGVRQVDSGNLDVTVPVRFSDELGFIGRAFNRMVSSIKLKNDQLARHSLTLEQRVRERTSELAKARDEAEAARIEAEAANQTKSIFLANMSHEFRTPLNAIIGYGEILEEDLIQSNRTDLIPDLLKIKGSGKHLLGLVNDVLDVSKIESGRVELFLELFDLQDVLSDVSQIASPAISQNNNRLILRYEAADTQIYADFTKVRQIIINLLSNAGKFTNDGTITTTVRDHELSEEQPAYMISVQDNGIGMSADQLERVFEPFQQGDNSTTRLYGGTGLGLAITNHFTLMMGGEISVKSQPNEGSCFTVIIPKQVEITEEQRLSMPRFGET